MKQYQIKEICGEPDWSKIPVLSMDNRYLQTADQNQAYAQLCWNEDFIFLHLWSEGSPFRAEETGPLGSPCEDSCLEFFCCPMEDDPRYLNIECNFNGCMYLGIGSSLDDLIRLVPDDADTIFSPRTRHTDKGWELFYQIPSAFVRRLFPKFRLYPGKQVRANCFACSDLAEKPYYLSWNLIKGEPFTFHRNQSFGLMTFTNN